LGFIAIPQEKAIEIAQELQKYHPKSGFGLILAHKKTMAQSTYIQLKALLVKEEEKNETSLAFLQLCVRLQMFFALQQQEQEPYRTMETLKEAQETVMTKKKTIGATVAYEMCVFFIVFYLFFAFFCVFFIVFLSFFFYRFFTYVFVVFQWKNLISTKQKHMRD
jgi:hypothetical protein